VDPLRRLPVSRTLQIGLASVLFCLVSCGFQDFTEPDYEGDDAGECSDDADNDRDGLVDCDDPGCFGTDTCSDSDDDDDSAPDDDDDSAPANDDDSMPDDDDTTGPFSEYDDFDENNIIWLHTDVSGWDVTSTVTASHINYTELCVFHTMAGQWPEVLGIFPEEPEAPMEGNIWVIARVDGLWYAATFDYLRPGDECKYEDFSPAGEGPGPSTFGAVPLSTWLPQTGEPVWMFMSTVARHKPLGPVHERSDYVLLIWP
jgi:hypothetical protein